MHTYFISKSVYTPKLLNLDTLRWVCASYFRRRRLTCELLLSKEHRRPKIVDFECVLFATVRAPRLTSAIQPHSHIQLMPAMTCRSSFNGLRAEAFVCFCLLKWAKYIWGVRFESSKHNIYANNGEARASPRTKHTNWRWAERKHFIKIISFFFHSSFIFFDRKNTKKKHFHNSVRVRHWLWFWFVFVCLLLVVVADRKLRLSNRIV